MLALASMKINTVCGKTTQKASWVSEEQIWGSTGAMDITIVR
jgi:hypothetical protein